MGSIVQCHFTSLVPQNKLDPPKDLKNFRNFERRTT